MAKQMPTLKVRLTLQYLLIAIKLVSTRSPWNDFTTAKCEARCDDFLVDPNRRVGERIKDQITSGLKVTMYINKLSLIDLKMKDEERNT